MKPKTTMSDGRLWCLGNVFYEIGSDQGIDSIAHDAAMAHALDAAIAELENDQSPEYSPAYVLAEVRRRAVEKMKDWGYTDETT